MRVLIACESSGIVRDAFLRRGHDAVSCDLLATERPGPHLEGDIMAALSYRWDLLIAHPTCTFLANSGVKHLYTGGRRENGPDALRWEGLVDGARFFRIFLEAKIRRKCVENPIVHSYARTLIGRDPSQIVQPWQFGHREMKATALYLEELPLLVPTDIVGPPPADPEERKSWARVHRASPGPDRWRERSRTFPGIADAFAAQWGVA